MNDPLAAFNAACLAKGIHRPADFAARYGRRLSDLSLAKALAIVEGVTPASDPRFPPRCGPALYHPPPMMTRDEQTAWRERWTADALPPLAGKDGAR